MARFENLSLEIQKKTSEKGFSYMRWKKKNERKQA